MKYIYKVREESYVTKIISEQIISLEYLDLADDQKQSLQEFKNFSKPLLQYKTDDFLILLDEERDEKLWQNKQLDLYEVLQFGWYYEKRHKTELQLFSSTSPTKISNLHEINPNLRIDSFDKYRNHYRPVKVHNVLTGAFGLCYSIFKKEYDNLFRKFKIQKDKWLLNRDKLETSDYVMLTQLFLLIDAKRTNLINEFMQGESLRGYRILGKYLKEAVNYFTVNDYSMKGFLNYFKATSRKSEELNPFAKGFQQLSERYVKYGMMTESENPITMLTKEFIDVAKARSSELKHFLEKEEFSKTSVFLLGMLHLGDRLDEQFSFDNFIPAIVNLGMKDLVDVSVNAEEVIFSFSANEVEKNRNNKFNYINGYIDELKTIKDLNADIYQLSQESSKLETNRQLRKDIKEIIAENKNLTTRKQGLIKQKDELKQKVEESEFWKKSYAELKKEIKEKELVKKAFKDLQDKKKKLKIKKRQLNEEIKDLKSELAQKRTAIKSMKKTQAKRKNEDVNSEEKNKKSSKETKNNKKNYKNRKSTTTKTDNKSGQTKILGKEDS